MSLPDLITEPSVPADDWPERLRAATEAAAARRRQRAAERREAGRRRAYGLIDRHALRLAEARARASAPPSRGLPPEMPD